MEMITEESHKKPYVLHIIVLQHLMTHLCRKLFLHVIHVTGTQMKELEIEVLSRGGFLEGVMAGKDPLRMLPL